MLGNDTRAHSKFGIGREMSYQENEEQSRIYFFIFFIFPRGNKWVFELKIGVRLVCSVKFGNEAENERFRSCLLLHWKE